MLPYLNHTAEKLNCKEYAKENYAFARAWNSRVAFQELLDSIQGLHSIVLDPARFKITATLSIPFFMKSLNG